MKKMALLVLTAVFLCGCTKNYKTVEEYETAMNAVIKENPSYTIEAKQPTPYAELYYKSYIKGNKWKTELSVNGGTSYMSTILYDGADLLSYSAGTPYAMVNPMVSAMSGEDPDIVNYAIAMQNPINSLIHWKDGGVEDDSKAEFVNNKDNKNGFDCRLIKFGTDREACVSDKYGIAVYHKLSTESRKNPGEKEDVTLNVVKISNTEIPDTEFELPEGVQKTDIRSMLQNMNKRFKSYEF